MRKQTDEGEQAGRFCRPCAGTGKRHYTVRAPHQAPSEIPLEWTKTETCSECKGKGTV